MRHIIEINTTDKKISSSHHQPTMLPAAMVDMISMGSSHPTLDTWTTVDNKPHRHLNNLVWSNWKRYSLMIKPHPETVEPVLGIASVVAESVDRPAHQPQRPQH